MAFIDADRTLPFLAVLVFVANAMILPVVRMRVRTGEWGLAIARTKDPVQRLVGAAITLATGGLLLWSLLYALLDGSSLGIWTVALEVKALGWIAMLAGFLVVVAAQANMGKSWRIGIDQRATALVTGGIYRVVRN